MRSESHWLNGGTVTVATALPAAQLVLVFGSGDAMANLPFETLRTTWPQAHIVGCSTAGEINDVNLRDDSLCISACHFEHSQVTFAKTNIADGQDSHSVGIDLGKQLAADGLRHVLVFTDGLNLDGTAFLAGLRGILPDGVSVTGGMAGDGTRFQRTLVCANAMPTEKTVVAVGLYGERLRIGYGSLGGWESFGPERHITRADGNVLYELDGESALALYKRYLGEYAAGLPASGLRFPLALSPDNAGEPWLVRTVLSVDEAKQSMTFAGALPTGKRVQLMKADFERLIDGANGAAKHCVSLGGANPALAILISCVGRRLILGQRVEEELDSVRELLGPRPQLCGFYSYGEFSPLGDSLRCELHNQTMTITTVDEV